MNSKKRDTKKKTWLFFLFGSLILILAPLIAGAQEDQITICILDSGCNELGVQGYDYLNDQKDLQDLQGHGTMVYQCLKEALPEEELLMLKCLYGEEDTERQAEKKAAEEAAVIRALHDAADVYHADIINISWTLNNESEALHEAIAYAYEKGCILVAAAGNLSFSTPLGSEAYPAAWSETIGVGGVDIDEQGEPVSSLWYLQSKAIFVCADGKYQGERGTSFAAPKVTAVIADYLQTAQQDQKTDQCVREYLKSIALDLGEEGYDPVFGWGYISL